MHWKVPPKIKVYEALGCIADKRLEIEDNSAKVYSSSKGKFYTVNYDPGKKAIMANDNGSYWKGYLGYPAIAFLMAKGVITYDSKFAEALKDIKWKDINQQFKNDFAKTEEYVKNLVKERGFSVEDLQQEVNEIHVQINFLGLSLLGEKIKPPQGY